jgi:hypothetical protein
MSLAGVAQLIRARFWRFRRKEELLETLRRVANTWLLVGIDLLVLIRVCAGSEGNAWCGNVRTVRCARTPRGLACARTSGPDHEQAVPCLARHQSRVAVTLE